MDSWLYQFTQRQGSQRTACSSLPKSKKRREDERRRRRCRSSMCEPCARATCWISRPSASRTPTARSRCATAPSRPACTTTAVRTLTLDECRSDAPLRDAEKKLTPSFSCVVVMRVRLLWEQNRQGAGLERALHVRHVRPAARPAAHRSQGQELHGKVRK